MKIAVTYNEYGGDVLQRRGPEATEHYNEQKLARVVEALRSRGHEVQAIEADLHVIERLENFFSPTADQPWPGMVFNLAYGRQGLCRYSHLPGILEMMGLPYLGSDPLGHALASDKISAKRIFRATGLPTAEFQVIKSIEKSEVKLPLPVIVKPSSEAVSLGVRKLDDVESLRAAVREDLQKYREPVLVESFIPGRELNVSLIGNSPATALPPVEVVLEGEDTQVYDTDTKSGRGPRGSRYECPARISPDVTRRACELATHAFDVLQCRDWARADFMLDEQDRLYLLEMNTIPGIGPHSSFFTAAKATGISDLGELLDRLIDAAVQRHRENGISVKT